MKKAAGPYNPNTRYGGAEKIAIKSGYVRVHNSGKAEGFIAAEKIAQAEGYFEKWYGSHVLTWLEQFRYKKNDELELVTTVDMASEDLRREGKDVRSTRSEADYLPAPGMEGQSWISQSSPTSNIASAIEECRKLFQVRTKPDE